MFDIAKFLDFNIYYLRHRVAEIMGLKYSCLWQKLNSFVTAKNVREKLSESKPF